MIKTRETPRNIIYIGTKPNEIKDNLREAFEGIELIDTLTKTTLEDIVLFEEAFKRVRSALDKVEFKLKADFG